MQISMRSTFVAYWSVFQCISVYLLCAMCNVFAMYLDHICSASAAYLQLVFVVYCNVQCIVYSVHCSDVQDRSQFASSSEENFSSPGKKVKLSRGEMSLREMAAVSSWYHQSIFQKYTTSLFVYLGIFVYLQREMTLIRHT